MRLNEHSPAFPPHTGRSASRSLVAAILFGAASCLCCTGGGCQAAKENLRADFTDFNSIIQQSQNEQMLLNLVRMRFRDAPLFLQAGSLTASYENTVSGGAQATAQQGDQSLVGVTGTYTYSSKPTITYTPVEGELYQQQLMKEIPSQNFGLLYRTGWPVQKLCDLLVESVTTSSGEVLSARPKSPTHPKFTQFVKTLVAAEAVGSLSFEKRADGGINLKVEDETISLENFQLRSLFSAMFDAAASIEVPEPQRSWTTAPSPDETINVHVSAKPPTDTILAIKYCGWYYSIASDDICSKDTLALFVQVYRIQSGSPSPGPVLTIPAR